MCLRTFQEIHQADRKLWKCRSFKSQLRCHCANFGRHYQLTSGNAHLKPLEKTGGYAVSLKRNGAHAAVKTSWQETNDLSLPRVCLLFQQYNEYILCVGLFTSVWVCACVWRQRTIPFVVLRRLILCFIRGRVSLLLSVHRLGQVVWFVNSRGSACLHLPSAQVTSTCHRFWGSKSDLYTCIGKHCTNLSNPSYLKPQG